MCAAQAQSPNRLAGWGIAFGAGACAVAEAVDPYARAVGVNGNRGMVVDLRQTDPEGIGRAHV